MMNAMVCSYRRRGASDRAGRKDFCGQEELCLDLHKDTKEQAYNDGNVVELCGYRPNGLIEACGAASLRPFSLSQASNVA